MTLPTPKNPNVFDSLRDKLKAIKAAPTFRDKLAVIREPIQSPTFTKIANTLHPAAVSQLQEALHPVIQSITENPLMSGVFHSEIHLERNIPLEVPHGLGRAPTGWNILHQDQAAHIFSLQDTNPHPDLTLILKSTADVTIHLHVL